MDREAVGVGQHVDVTVCMSWRECPSYLVMGSGDSSHGMDLCIISWCMYLRAHAVGGVAALVLVV